MDNLTASEFRAALAHGAIKSISIRPTGSRFQIHASTLRGGVTLSTTKGKEPRLFSSLDAAFKLVHEFGVSSVVLDQMEKWQAVDADMTRRKRPDKSVALRNAADYDRWVKSKVQASRHDERPPILSAAWSLRRQSKQEEMAKLKSEAV